VQGLAIVGPIAPMREKVLGLSCTGTGVWVSKVIGAPNETGIGGTIVVVGEGTIDVGRALRGLGMISVSIRLCERPTIYLGHEKWGTGIIGTREVHVDLVAGDIKALNPIGAGLQRIGTRSTSCEKEGQSSSLHDGGTWSIYRERGRQSLFKLVGSS